MPAYSGGLLSAIGLDGAAPPKKATIVAPPANSMASVVTPAPEIAPPPRVVTRLVPAPVIAAPVIAAPVIAAPVIAAPVIVAERAPPLQSNAQITVAYPTPVVATRELDYRIDAGDKLRVVVYGQEGLTNSYAIDAGGGLTMPLIGRVEARGLTPVGLAAHITARLRKGYIREPSVAVEIESYRPFFILGEVAAPGQYPYVPNMSVEFAVAIAGGFSPRARRDSVIVTHQASGAQYRAAVPLGTPLSPGDTITVGERWF